MITAPLPENESQRLAALLSCEVLDTSPEPEFDDLTRLVASLCDTPAAVISLVDQDRQWFKSVVGLDAKQTSRDISFCAHALLEPTRLLEVPNALDDPRFADNPLVNAAPGIRFYAGQPLLSANGLAMGTLAVLDFVPRQLTADQAQALRTLATQASSLLQLRQALAKQAQQQARLEQSAAEMAQQLSSMAAMNQELTRQQRWLRTLSDHLPAVVYYVDQDQRYRFANEYHRTLGRDPVAIIGKTMREVIGQERYAWLQDQIEAALQGRAVCSESDSPIVGSWVERHYVPDIDDSGTVRGFFGMSYDVTERKQMVTRLRQQALDLAQASQYKSEFLAHMSHELRTPLNSMLLLSGLLAENRQGNLSATQVQHSRVIHDAGQSLLALINDILDLAKIEAGHRQTWLTEIDLSAMVREVEGEFHALAQKHALDFSITLDPALPRSFVSDAARLRQILRNLLANAFKFTHQGRVALVIGPVPADRPPLHCQSVAFAVTDSGIGIAPDKRELIFSAFQQADASTTRRYGGTGLGLSISHELARMLEGAITLKSEMGVGSTFTLYLPLATKLPA